MSFYFDTITSIVNFLYFNLFSGRCGAVGRADDSDARDLQFEYSHRQFYLLSGLKDGTEKTKIMEKIP